MTRNDTDRGNPDHDIPLRTIFSAAVSDVSMPAGLLDRAIRRNRKRARRNGLIGGVAAAGVLAAAIGTAVGWAPGHHPASPRPVAKPHPQRPASQHPQLLTAAYVVDHVTTALVNSYHLISVDRGTGGMDSGDIIYTDVATQQQHYVGGIRDSSGQPYLQTATTVRDNTWTEFDVDYADRVYSTLTASDTDHGQKVSVSSWLPLQSNGDPVVAFRQALKAGAITVAGHRVLDGRDTIVLRVTDPSVPLSQGPPSWIWVDASTYMVVQTEHFIHAYKGGTFIPPTPASRMTWMPLFDRVTWLSPTPQNMALLTLTPPAGFTGIPYSQMVSYLGKIS